MQRKSLGEALGRMNAGQAPNIVMPERPVAGDIARPDPLLAAFEGLHFDEPVGVFPLPDLPDFDCLAHGFSICPGRQNSCASVCMNARSASRAACVVSRARVRRAISAT